MFFIARNPQEGGDKMKLITLCDFINSYGDIIIDIIAKMILII